MPRLRPSHGRRLALRAAAALLAVLLGAPGTVAARSDLESQLKSVVSVELRGRHAVARREIDAVLKTRPPSIWPWGERRTLRADFLRSDCEAIELLYRQHGYLDARGARQPGAGARPGRACGCCS